MNGHASLQTPTARHDGFGSRHHAQDAQFGRVEILDLSSALGTPVAEQAIRARAARLAEANSPTLSRVVRITRADQTLSIVSMAPDGVVLGDLLAAVEFGTVTLSDQAILELANATVGAVAGVHQLSPSAAHGALSPAHARVRRDGTVLLSGAVFADALQALQCNREQLWRVFGVALPPSATLPRFDQRSDVTQLGALVLAMLLRRTLAASEYPKGILDLVAAAADAVSVENTSRSALRMWLQQALQLHPKAMFASAADAARAFEDVIAGVSGRRAGAVLLQAVIRQMSGEPMPDEADPPAKAAVRQPIVVAMPADAAPPVRRPTGSARGMTFLRHVFPMLGAN
jgi:hypothetical protein